MTSHKFTAEQLLHYLRLSADEADRFTRSAFGIPVDRYYNVALFPESAAGMVTVRDDVRVVTRKKISKSDAVRVASTED